MMEKFKIDTVFQVALAVEKKSDKLEVNDLKTKVRRLEPLPEYDETTPSRTVVALNLPIERPTIESVAEMFSVCGEIVLVRILRPGNPIPADVRPFFNKHPEMTSKVCALVEFEKTEFALKAIKQLTNEEGDKMKVCVKRERNQVQPDSWLDSLRLYFQVMEMMAPPPAKTGKKSEEKKKSTAVKSDTTSRNKDKQPQRRYSQGMMPPQMMVNAGNSEAAGQASGPRRKLSLIHNMKFSSMAEEQKKGPGLNPNAPIFTMQQRRLSRPSQPSAPTHFMVESAFGMMPMQTLPGWMSRRFTPQMDYPGVGMAMSQAVVRQPRGPAAEKGKGFQKWCRTRMEPTVTRKPGPRAVPIVAPPSGDDLKKEKVAEKNDEGVANDATEKKVANEVDEGHFSDQDNEKSR